MSVFESSMIDFILRGFLFSTLVMLLYRLSRCFGPELGVEIAGWSMLAFVVLAWLPLQFELRVGQDPATLAPIEINDASRPVTVPAQDQEAASLEWDSASELSTNQEPAHFEGIGHHGEFSGPLESVTR